MLKYSFKWDRSLGRDYDTTAPNTSHVNLYDTDMNNAVCHEDFVLCYVVSIRNNMRINLHLNLHMNIYTT